jgi:hypothetical protein
MSNEVGPSKPEPLLLEETNESETTLNATTPRTKHILETAFVQPAMKEVISKCAKPEAYQLLQRSFGLKLHQEAEWENLTPNDFADRLWDEVQQERTDLPTAEDAEPSKDSAAAVIIIPHPEPKCLVGADFDKIACGKSWLSAQPPSIRYSFGGALACSLFIRYTDSQHRVWVQRFLRRLLTGYLQLSSEDCSVLSPLSEASYWLAAHPDVQATGVQMNIRSFVMQVCPLPLRASLAPPPLLPPHTRAPNLHRPHPDHTRTHPCPPSGSADGRMCSPMAGASRPDHTDDRPPRV